MIKLKNAVKTAFLKMVLGYSLDSRDRAIALQAPYLLYHIFGKSQVFK